MSTKNANDASFSWEPAVFRAGQEPIVKESFTELQDAIDTLPIALTQHKADTSLETAHGSVTSQKDGFVTRDILKEINSLLQDIESCKTIAATKMLPKGIVVLQDSNVIPSTWGDKWVWCSGSGSSTLDLKKQNIIGYYSTSFGFPENSYTEVTTGTGLKFITADGKYMQRI